MAEILALDQSGQRLIPLVSGVCSSEQARNRLNKQTAKDMFPHASGPREALSGLWLYFSCADECHEIVQDLNTSEASFWHAILHRQEPDPANSAYWFRSLGEHPVFHPLSTSAQEISARYPDAGFRLARKWDPLLFVDFCEKVRQQPRSPAKRLALEIQRAEWQLLFDYCARPRS